MHKKMYPDKLMEWTTWEFKRNGRKILRWVLELMIWRSNLYSNGWGYGVMGHFWDKLMRIQRITWLREQLLNSENKKPRVRQLLPHAKYTSSESYLLPPNHLQACWWNEMQVIVTFINPKMHVFWQYPFFQWKSPLYHNLYRNTRSFYCSK
jgi:hypothetical protein